MSAYCGTTIPAFPNFFMLAGPNTGIGHTSLVVMIEAQVAHVVGALRPRSRPPGPTAVEVRPEVAERLERRDPGQGRPDGVELGWLLELVPR